MCGKSSHVSTAISLDNIRDAKAGDHDAFRLVVEKSKPLIRSILSHMDVPESEKEDLEQEAFIGLFKAVMLYDANCASFTTFSYLCIRRTVFSALKKYNSKKNAPLRNSLSLSESEEENIPLFTLPSLHGDPERILLDNESYTRFLSRLDSELSGYEKKVLKLYLSDCTYDQIALALNVPPKSVGNALQRIRNKLKLRD
jgi:RNA polymerase sporulation-specific sigma factor